MNLSTNKEILILQFVIWDTYSWHCFTNSLFYELTNARIYNFSVFHLFLFLGLETDITTFKELALFQFQSFSH